SLVREARPDAIIHVAARVGGIADRVAHPSGYLMDNLLIDTSVLSAALDSGVPECLYVSSAAIYPAETPQPITEEALLTGPLEGPLESYALAKIAGARFCAYASHEFGVHYRAMVPANMYGPGEDYSPERSHLVASAIRKTHEAKASGTREVQVWGDGTARREVTFVGDVSDFMVSQLGHLQAWPDLLNVGYGDDITVREVYEAAREVVDADVELVFDTSRPVGVNRRLLDSTRARALGWQPTTDLLTGMRLAYAAYASDLTTEGNPR
ncbi:MAG: NAD-dependent epimerase/dehydratase family protein, partial [Demequinaceae bacterium]|nr:NAD-dependent epimerase/dehydratase family protein [Demequinaceae bacterium]